MMNGGRRVLLEENKRARERKKARKKNGGVNQLFGFKCIMFRPCNLMSHLTFFFVFFSILNWFSHSTRKGGLFANQVGFDQAILT